MQQWYLLYAKSRQEAKAAHHLNNQGIESYFPKHQVQKLVRGKRASVLEPLFPNYLFVAVDPEVHSFTSIRSTRGISCFVRFGDVFSVVPPELIALLRQQEQQAEPVENRAELPHAGDRVHIIDGPFSGLEAIYRCEDGLERSILLIKLLQDDCEVSVGNLQFASQAC